MLTFPCVKAQKAAIAGPEVSASAVSARAVDSVVVELGGHPAEEEGEDVVCGEVEQGAVEGAVAVYENGVGAGGGKVVKRGEGRGNGGGFVVGEDY